MILNTAAVSLFPCPLSSALDIFTENLFFVTSHYSVVKQGPFMRYDCKEEHNHSLNVIRLKKFMRNLLA